MARRSGSKKHENGLDTEGAGRWGSVPKAHRPTGDDIDPEWPEDVKAILRRDWDTIAEDLEAEHGGATRHGNIPYKGVKGFKSQGDHDLLMKLEKDAHGGLSVSFYPVTQKSGKPCLGPRTKRSALVGPFSDSVWGAKDVKGMKVKQKVIVQSLIELWWHFFPDTKVEDYGIQTTTSEDTKREKTPVAGKKRRGTDGEKGNTCKRPKKDNKRVHGNLDQPDKERPGGKRQGAIGEKSNTSKRPKKDKKFHGNKRKHAEQQSVGISDNEGPGGNSSPDEGNTSEASIRSMRPAKKPRIAKRREKRGKKRSTRAVGEAKDGLQNLEDSVGSDPDEEGCFDGDPDPQYSPVPDADHSDSSEQDSGANEEESSAEKRKKQLSSKARHSVKKEAKYNRRFQKKYPDLAGPTDTWEAYDKGVVHFDLNEKSTCWVISKAWLAGSSERSELPPPTGDDLRKFESDRRLTKDGLITSTASFILWSIAPTADWKKGTIQLIKDTTPEGQEPSAPTEVKIEEMFGRLKLSRSEGNLMVPKLREVFWRIAPKSAEGLGMPRHSYCEPEES